MQTSPYFWFQKEICIPWIHLRSNSTISPVSLWCVMLPTRELSAMWQQSLISTPVSVVTNSNSSSGFYCRGEKEKVVDHRKREWAFYYNQNHLIKYKKNTWMEKKSSLKLIVCQLLLYYTETWLSSNKNLSLLVLQALKQQSPGAAHPPLLQFWKPDGPQCNCFNGGKGEGILKDWLRDLVSRWTNQRGSQGHSQGPRQTNIPVSPLSHPCTFALTNT